jgi:speckle-type POZ protein
MATKGNEVGDRIPLKRTNFKWEIKNFREKTESLESKTFSDPEEQTKWSLVLFPDGNCTKNKGWISIFLDLIDTPLDSVRVSCKLRIVYPSREVSRKFKDHNFKSNDKTKNFGFGKFERRKVCLKCNSSESLTILCVLNFSEYKLLTPAETLLFNNETLFEAGDYNDCTLICDGVQVPACKFLLASQSPVFRAMFIGESEEAKTNRVKIDDIRAEVMQELARFTACGKIEKFDGIIEELLMAADKYEVETLKELCSTQMIASLTKENICHRLAIADRHNVISVKRGAIAYLKRNDINIKELPDFKHLITPEHQDLIIEIVYSMSTSST